MKLNAPIICLFAGLLLTFAACKKEEDPEIDPVPVISMDQVSQTRVPQFTDDLTLTISYEDQDGDLGFESADSMAIEVQDSRLSQPDLYHLRPLSPPETQLHIKGSIDVVVLAPFLLGNGGDETLTYTLRIRDRAGNWSNKVVSPPITITQ